VHECACLASVLRHRSCGVECAKSDGGDQGGSANVRNAYWLSRVDVRASLVEYDLVLALARTATCARSQTRRFLSFVRSHARSRTGVVRRARLPKRERS
jgi:hypothetical protein